MLNFQIRYNSHNEWYFNLSKCGSPGACHARRYCISKGHCLNRFITYVHPAIEEGKAR